MSKLNVRVTAIVEWTDPTGGAQRHALPDGSRLSSTGAASGYVGRVMGPGHEPYWLKDDGTASKKLVLTPH